MGRSLGCSEPPQNAIASNSAFNSKTSLDAFIVNSLSSWSMHWTPVAFPSEILILLTLISVKMVKFSLSNAGTRYAFAALHLLPFFCVVW